MFFICVFTDLSLTLILCYPNLVTNNRNSITVTRILQFRSTAPSTVVVIVVATLALAAPLSRCEASWQWWSGCRRRSRGRGRARTLRPARSGRGAGSRDPNFWIRFWAQSNRGKALTFGVENPSFSNPLSL